jgi:hypothetical protein
MVDGSRCGKVLHGGAVLVAAMGSSEGDQGSAVGAMSGGKKGCSRGGWRVWAAFIAGRGGGRRRCGGESGGAETTAGNQRCRGSNRLPMVCVSGRQLSDRWAWAVLTGWSGSVDMGWVQSGAQHFSNYSNFAPILKYKTKTILMSINVQAWHGLKFHRRMVSAKMNLVGYTWM